MDLDDSRIRRMILTARPDIQPKRFEVSEMDHGAVIGYWFRHETGEIMTGSAIALHRTEKEVAEELLSRIMAEEGRRLISTTDAIDRSPYEGKRGKHPKTCTCSKHLKAASGETQ